MMRCGFVVSHVMMNHMTVMNHLLVMYLMMDRTMLGHRDTGHG